MKPGVANLLRGLVGARGFEPRTSCAQGRRATRLRYAPTVRKTDCSLHSERGSTPLEAGLSVICELSLPARLITKAQLGGLIQTLAVAWV